jgi:hypothetical protein
MKSYSAPVVDNTGQVNSRGNTPADKNIGAQFQRSKSEHALIRGHITIEQVVARYGSVHVETAWLWPDGEGFIAWVGDPPQAGKACAELQAALAEAVIACGGAVHDGRGKRLASGARGGR